LAKLTHVLSGGKSNQHSLAAIFEKKEPSMREKLMHYLLTMVFSIASCTVFLATTAFAASPFPTNTPSAPPVDATRPAVVGGFVASAFNLAPGQVGINVEHAKFKASFDFSGNKFTQPDMSINTYDVYGAVTDKLIIGFGASDGQVIDTYGKYKIDNNLDLLFGKKRSDNNVDVYCQYNFPFPIKAFIGTREFGNSPIGNGNNSSKLVYGMSAFFPFAQNAGVHGMVAKTSLSLEWQVGLDVKLDKKLSMSLQYRGYDEDGVNSSTFKLRGLGLDLNYLF
jgi:hypothetical protein